MKSSSGESSESDDEETSQKGDFADFQSFQKLIKKEGSIDDVPVSIRSSISSVDNDSHQNLEDCFKNYIGGLHIRAILKLKIRKKHPRSLKKSNFRQMIM